VSTKIIETVRGRDSKRYPAGLPLPRAVRYEAIVLAHWLVHDRGLSHREAQQELLQRGIRRSTGWIAYNLGRPMCDHCREPDGG
jgi:hypothetical protein